MSAAPQEPLTNEQLILFMEQILAFRIHLLSTQKKLDDFKKNMTPYPFLDGHIAQQEMFINVTQRQMSAEVTKLSNIIWERADVINLEIINKEK